MKSKSDPRHNARKLALTSVFCWIFSEQDPQGCLDLSKDLLEVNNADLELTNKLSEGVRKHRKEIDELITKHAPEWPIDKIAKVDLVILRVAIYEIVFGELPKKIAIDEAVELAKEFGNETSSKFVNGVLGSLVEEFEEGKTELPKEVEKVA
ncbi:transcription antitermination factor NusB [candidate division WWE3 bacterium RIFCSPHIGHO2_01_FULL_42_13]|uniref:Transcription antitermination protein NusB n=1 Tax=candidate division WWE3 bacterium RIFCSPHIGHO2_01_FULL_42_13 TaxID=1802617 RepID=A0A1F4URQ3_UNCKA|nr:MAG: transcription antitermination factor NusB [candidate division WWE3 bacterium RIFCSPHIGHO2_01_FULL_42_13]